MKRPSSRTYKLLQEFRWILIEVHIYANRNRVVDRGVWLGVFGAGGGGVGDAAAPVGGVLRGEEWAAK